MVKRFATLCEELLSELLASSLRSITTWAETEDGSSLEPSSFFRTDCSEGSFESMLFLRHLLGRFGAIAVDLLHYSADTVEEVFERIFGGARTSKSPLPQSKGPYEQTTTRDSYEQEVTEPRRSFFQFVRQRLAFAGYIAIDATIFIAEVVEDQFERIQHWLLGARKSSEYSTSVVEIELPDP